ncbi:hypothetical protein niasHT_024695 [Heterodera trifolii]|uniref:Effector protein n=1 Tax=Heterodera trifolii TaxID=157864 RepID=A0ABD2JUR5_9BILA
MNDIKPILIVLFFLIVNSTNGLNCSHGFSIKSYDERLENKEDASNMYCFDDDHYCVAVICTKAGSRGFSAIYWGCAAEYMKNDVYYLGIKAKMRKKFGANYQCQRLYGEKDENMDNLKFTRPPVPNGLMCLKGEMDAKGNGAITRGLCTDEEHYCFKARCAKEINGEWKMKWGCSTIAGNCDFVNTKNDEMDKCPCLFGEKDIDFSNENLTIEIPTVMTTPIQTTLTTKETTTTTTTTTTITTEEPTKPTTTATLELAQSTINEGNGVRVSNAIICAVQLLIVAAKQFNVL